MTQFRRYALLPLAIVGSLIGMAHAQTGTGTEELAAFLEGSTSLRGALIPLFLSVTVLSLAPGLAMMVTCFPFMAIVFSFLRQAIGLQHAPPAMMLTSLALFLTVFVMQPVFADAWQAGIEPYLDGRMTEVEGFVAVSEPLRAFMLTRTEPDTVMRLADAANMTIDSSATAPMRLLIPSFMLTEITRAFQIGFAIFLPFLVIDLVVASVLMAMGMMMVPPAVVSLPFKLAFFVLADGWVKLTEALLRGYLQ
ncbi:flagellar type III secretion system pore protein FliP [Parvularcula sp. LCG005]|uniref:flagellar type III secretion system pore protein FliP n=1 Tax=Parvularcula sp. LCG005 TaxID=3078805 RepID=UPI0029425129|nr:flagellar type III secretion system pore protein FliP [Parvularcula sp. LCG005]WOI52932.1 flagellar type III secretion system pore protein FliP [Parvularcula sp. LCG005]